MLWLDRLRGLTHYELGFHGDLFQGRLCSVKPVQDALRCESPHFGERLADRRKPWIIERSRVDIVESDDRYIGRHANPKVLKRTYCANRRQVIEGDHRGESRPLGKELLDDGVTQLRGTTQVAVELHN